MTRIAFLFIVAALLLVPSAGWAEVRVLKADCAQYPSPPALPSAFSPFNLDMRWPRSLAPQLQVDDKGNLVCSHSGLDPGVVSETVYSKQEIDRQMDTLKSGLQETLKDAVFAAAVKHDQLDELENEMWRRLNVKYRMEIQALDQQINDLKTKLQMLGAAAAAAPSPTNP